MVTSVGDASRLKAFLRSAEGILAVAAAVAIGVSFVLWANHAPRAAELAPLIAIVAVGGLPLVWRISKDFWAREPGADYENYRLSAQPAQLTSPRS